MCVCFFFFKQKTAYEMRISDWSSDVCSSDLGAADHPRQRDDQADAGRRHTGADHDRDRAVRRASGRTFLSRHLSFPEGHQRSEEHTSELQSLMRISYAVFCLKKNNHENSELTLLTYKA